MTTEPQNSDQQPTSPATEAQPAADAAAPAVSETDKLKAEVADLKDKLLRALADTENLRRRSEREREDTMKYAAGKFAGDIVTVADNLRRAIESVPAADASNEMVKTLIAGVEATERELLGIFGRHGIARIEAVGAKFDANLHEALFEIPDPSKPNGTVMQEVSSGWTIHGRLLRAAKVGVSKGGPAQAPAAPGSQVNTQA